ncbi:FAD:protein FMN transferase [Paludibacterium purpuratum]|uniref:FAD:protein FMN transferase n=1 Tax=Paludibacterium purpuratum TaxID=1144873 RepID=A0A4R7B9G8_9NEIS|nr:FAD:protein FMN transferase [Paludibacterium purpuratum]TDR81540.1 thiamine biosynthesis lipoprotein [Paludibacterium purpuratum]
MLKVRRLHMLLLGALALAAILLLTLRQPQLYAQGTYVFGTRVQLSLYGRTLEEAQQDTNAVFAHFVAMQDRLHAWKPSELTRLNSSIAAGKPFHASPQLAAILSHAQSLSTASSGLFDPGIGSLIRLWGFQADQFGVTPPTLGQVQRLMQPQPTIQALHISQSGWISSSQRNIALDLGGYAKGWALDEAARILRARGVKNALIDVGGNLLALGRKGDQPWTVGIQDPRRPEPLATLALQDGEAIGTSGDYQRYFVANGKRYCHILDPRTGLPASRSESVTVLVPPGPYAGALSDGASKPAFIAGSAHALWLSRKLGVSAMLMVDQAGRVWVSPAMLKRISLRRGEAPPAILGE